MVVKDNNVTRLDTMVRLGGVISITLFPIVLWLLLELLNMRDRQLAMEMRIDYMEKSFATMQSEIVENVKSVAGQLTDLRQAVTSLETSLRVK
jgi:hypothetical protein